MRAGVCLGPTALPQSVHSRCTRWPFLVCVARTACSNRRRRFLWCVLGSCLCCNWCCRLGLIWYLLWAKNPPSIMQVARLSRVAIRGVTSRAMSTYTTTNFINGKFVESAGTEVYPLHNPVSDGENIIGQSLHLHSPPLLPDGRPRPPARPLASHHASPRCPMFTSACDVTAVDLWGGCDGSVKKN